MSNEREDDREPIERDFERRIARKPSRRAERPQERFLRDLTRLRLVRQHVPGDAVDGGPVAGGERREGGVLAAAHPLGEHVIVLTIRHRH